MRVPRQHVLVLVDPTPHSVGSMMEAGPENVLDVLELLEPFMEPLQVIRSLEMLVVVIAPCIECVRCIVSSPGEAISALQRSSCRVK
jgi:hypothetical protein